jgi:hypothetical protein
VSANIRLRAALCLALSLANAARARADDQHLYRWVDRDGRLHITATPPPADASPAAVTPSAHGTVQLVPTAPAVAPPAPAVEVAPTPPPPRAPAPPAASDGSDPCEPHRALIESWLAAKDELGSATAEVESIDASPLLGSRTDCSDAALLAHRCRESWFSRDAALARANERQSTAEQKLARIEETARIAGVPMVCLVDPAE